MKIPFVSFLPMERELDHELREAFNRVFEASWYIEGKEIVADDVFLCVAQIETIIAIDASYTSDSDVELIPIRD